jgi:hypothetical protein
MVTKHPTGHDSHFTTPEYSSLFFLQDRLTTLKLVQVLRGKTVVDEYLSPNVMAEWLPLFLGIRKVQDSNPGSGTGILTTIFVAFLSPKRQMSG